MDQRKLKILIADDVQLELEMERTFFQRSGFQVLTAKDGHAALAQAASEKPDLIILDQIMPGLSGTDVCRALKTRKETQGIPVVIISQVDRDDVRTLCKEVGADAFVSKSEGRDALLHEAALILKIPERKSLRLTVFFLAQDIVGAKESLGTGVNLSESGLGLETTRRYAEGAVFQMRFMLPGERQEHKADARVVSVQDKGKGTYLLGLEFTQMAALDRKRLNQYLDKTLCATI